MSEAIDRETCWFNRFHPTEPRCENEARWHNPRIPNTFAQATRWCDEHRHEEDVPLASVGADGSEGK